MTITQQCASSGGWSWLVKCSLAQKGATKFSRTYISILIPACCGQDGVICRTRRHPCQDAPIELPVTIPRSRVGIFKQSMGARNRVGIGISYRPAWLHRLAELIP